MASRVSLTSRGGGLSLALIGRPSSDGVTIKIPYGVDFYYTDQSRTQSYLFLLVWFKLNLILLLDQFTLAEGDES